MGYEQAAPNSVCLWATSNMPIYLCPWRIGLLVHHRGRLSAPLEPVVRASPIRSSLFSITLCHHLMYPVQVNTGYLRDFVRGTMVRKKSKQTPFLLLGLFITSASILYESSSKLFALTQMWIWWRASASPHFHWVPAWHLDQEYRSLQTCRSNIHPEVQSTRGDHRRGMRASIREPGLMEPRQSSAEIL